MLDKLKKRIKSFQPSTLFSLAAIIISLFSLLYSKFSYDDERINTELLININKYRSLVEYEKRIELFFQDDGKNIIEMFERVKGLDFIYEYHDLVEYVFLTKVTYDLVNDSYEQFFFHNNIQDIYNDVGGSIGLMDILILQKILWNNNNFYDINYITINEIIENLTNINLPHKRDKLNSLIVRMQNEKQMISEKIESNYNIALIKNNIGKGLIEEYYKLNDYHHGLVLIQKDWFNSTDHVKGDRIELYITNYFSSILSEKALKKLMNREEW
jgi:hypothetical protein